MINLSTLTPKEFLSQLRHAVDTERVTGEAAVYLRETIRRLSFKESGVQHRLENSGDAQRVR